MADEVIGSIAVQIVGDYSSLQGDIDQATQVAAKGGAEIAQALNAGAAGADALSSAVSAAALGMGSFESQIEALVSSGSTLAEALAAVGTGADAVATGVETAGAAAAEAATQMDLFDAAIEVPYADAAGQLSLFATELEPIAASAHQAAEATEEVAHAAEDAGQATHEAAAGGMSEFREKLIAFAEAAAIVETIKTLGEQALEAADNITRASISLTALTDSGEKAESTINAIEQLGIQDGLSLPALLQASTRMTALLGAGAPVPELLAKIADGAAVMGKDIGSAADAFDRLATMGTLGARQLLPLGLTLDKVAESMNAISGTSEATAENAAKMFKALDQADRVKVLSAALDELGGIAQETAEKTFGGQWQILANEWEQIMRSVGDAILPVITNLTDLAKTEILPFLKSAVDAFNELPTPVKEVAVMVGLLGAAIVPVSLAIGGLGIAFAAAADAIAPIAAAFVSLGTGITGVGASYTAMMAAGVGSVAVWAGLAIAIADVVAAYVSMARAEDLAATSQVNASKSLQEYESRLVQHGIDISALKTQYDQGTLSTDQYIAALGKLRDGYLAAHPVIVDHAAATVAVLNPTEALGIKMQALAEAVTATRDKLAATTQAYNEHKATTQDVAKAYDAWQSATGALKSAQAALLPVVTSATEGLRAFDQSSLDAVTTQQAVADKLKSTTDLIGQQGLTLAHAQTELHDVLALYDKGLTTWQQVKTALDAVNTAQKAIDATWDTSPIDKNMKSLADATDQTSNAFAKLIPQVQFLPGPLGQAYAILDQMHVKMGENGRDVEQLAVDYVKLGTVPHTLDMMDVAWEKVSGSIHKVAAQDLPLAIAAMQTHLQQLEQEGKAQGVILQGQADLLNLQIQNAEQSGKSATAQIVALEGVSLRQKALIDDATLWGNTIKSVANDAIKGFVGMGAGMAQVIVEGGNMGKVFVDTAKKIAEAILTDIIQAGLQKVVDMIVMSVVPAIGSQVAPVVSTTAAIHAMQLAMATATTSMMANITALNAGFASLSASIGGSGAASGATSGAGGAVSGAAGMMGTAGAVGSIVGAISSIIGNFQNAHMETSLNAIEHNTRFLQIEAEKFFLTDEWDRYTGLLNKLDDIWNAIRDVSSEITKAGLGIMGALGTVPQFASGGMVGADMFARLHAGEVVVPRSDVPLLPRLPSLPQLSSPAAGNYGANAPSSVTGGANTFNIYGASDARETARQIADTLKSLSPKYTAYAT